MKLSHIVPRRVWLVVWALVVVSPFTMAEVVKKSSSGICHDTDSTFYNRTKNFEGFETLQDCIDSGGRISKSRNVNNQQKNMGLAVQEADVEGRAYSKVYNRDEWRHWLDIDNDCQSLRHELLIEQSKTPVTFTNSKQCTVKSGQWLDPFSGKTYYSARQLQIDHVIPLKFAHEHGGDVWSEKAKEKFANDRENLLVVYGPLNGSKSAQGPDTWLPPNHQFRCTYIRLFDGLMNKYELEYTSSEYRTIQKMLSHCT